MTLGGGHATSQRITRADPDSVWWHLSQNSMAEDGFQTNPLRTLHHSNKPLTALTTTLDMEYYMTNNYPCGLKVAWKGRQPSFYTFGFPKESPLLPFFNYVFKISRERGLLFGLKKQWDIIAKKSKCATGGLAKVSFFKVFLLFPLLMIGIVTALMICLFENLRHMFEEKSTYITSKSPNSQI